MGPNKETVITILIKQLQQKPLTPVEQSILDEWVAVSGHGHGGILDNECDEAELRKYLQHFSDTKKTQQALDRFRSKAFNVQPQFSGAYDPRSLLQDIESSNSSPTAAPAVSFRPFLQRWGWVAACFILAMVIAGYFLMSGPGIAYAVADARSTAPGKEITPGKEGAVLTLADGSTLVLDSLGNGIVASQQGVQAVLRDGQLIYVMENDESGGLSYNTIVTPKGRQFQLKLSDGSRVWLNSASSIKFPTLFSGNERKVQITGEAFFEVSKDAKKPFIVEVDGKSTVEVLGTQFNVNGYGDEGAILTTLFEGSVQISFLSNEAVSFQGAGFGSGKDAGKQKVVLRPGQQAQTGEGRSINVIDVPDLGQVAAWKNGYFDFNNIGLLNVLRQLERWYDIQIKYEGEPSAITVKGKMYRDVNLSDVLEVLDKMGLQFKVEGRTVIVHGDSELIPSG